MRSDGESQLELRACVDILACPLLLFLEPCEVYTQSLWRIVSGFGS